MDEFTKSVRPGPGGLRCPCCDDGYCRKRKSKRGKHSLSQLKRTRLKQELRKDINSSA